MTTANIFEQASRQKLRFETSKGNIGVEDLWDLPLLSQTGKPNLDDIAVGLYKQLKNEDYGLSFVRTESKRDSITQLKFDIVKHIVDVRLAENTVAATARANAEKRQQIMAIISQKETEALSSGSVEELRALLASLS